MKHMFLLFFVFAVAVNLFSQTPEPHYVVIDDAREEIDMLSTRNKEMERSSSALEEENRDLEAQIIKGEEFIVQANAMIDQLSASAGELYTLLQTVNDPDTKRELQDRMTANRQSRYDLENRKRRENELISTARSRIESNRKKIAVNSVRGNANDQRIEFLQACIDLSINENQDVDMVLDNADQIRKEVERLLNR